MMRHQFLQRKQTVSRACTDLVSFSESFSAVCRAEDVKKFKSTQDNHQEVVWIHHGCPHLWENNPKIDPRMYLAFISANIHH